MTDQNKHDDEADDIIVVWEGSIPHNGELGSDLQLLTEVAVPAPDIYAKIYIRTKEGGHNKPHFHVQMGDEEGSYSIADCERLDKGGRVKGEKKIKRYWGCNQDFLAETWNRSRPTDREYPKAHVSDDWEPSKEQNEWFEKNLKEK